MPFNDKIIMFIIVMSIYFVFIIIAYEITKGISNSSE